jgi:hypothetical protein
MSLTGAQWRKLACALPEVEEKSHFEQPDFRVRNKIFAGMNPEETQGSLKLPLEMQAMLLDAKPNVFTPAPGAWGRLGWTYVNFAGLDARAAPELLLEAWRLIAPKKLVTEHGGAQPAAAVQKKAPAPKKRAKKRR